MAIQIPPKLQRNARLLAVVLFLVALLAVAELSGIRAHFTLTFLRETLAANPVTGVAVFVLLFGMGNLIQIPGWIFLAAAVLAFGEVNGGLVTYLAATVSCTVTFLTVRLLGGNALQTLNNRFALRVMQRLHAHPVQSVIVLRTVFQTLPALNFALALSGISFKRYLAGTLCGLPLPIALYCLFFDFLLHLKTG
jgi:uncharacterized membrane protein YdjX (TVP38/TMEM64 family)